MRIILLRCGLANRLRTIVGFVYSGFIQQEEYVFHWDITDKACNGSFNANFNPLVIEYCGVKHHITIEDKSPSPKYNYYFIGQDTIKSILMREAPEIRDIPQVENLIYPNIRPKKYILNKVNRFLENYNSPRITAAIHIRRTDHIRLAKENNKYTDDTTFKKFIEKNRDSLIYLATDDAKVQDQYQKWKNVVIYKKIKPSENLRQTSLEDAIIDVFIAAAVSKQFCGSGYSSYSHLIEIYRRINQYKSKHFYLYK